MKRFIRIVLPVAVIGLSIGIALFAVATKPEIETRVRPPNIPLVDVMQVSPGEYRVRVHTRGTVRPRTESTLIPEVSGRIVDIAANFRQGSFFETGDELLRIDARDYVTAVTIAQGDLAQVELRLTEEQARARQAERDWERLGETGGASALVLRKPQVASAAAAVAAAQAGLAQARLNLERTRIDAPYAGRVLEQNVDVGQYVTPATVLGRVYAVDYVEIRLPLTDRQLEFLDVPEVYRGESAAADIATPKVVLTAKIGRQTHSWEGRIVRTEGAIDTASRQLFMIAQVDDPYGRRRSGAPPLKVGQFVEATIEGTLLQNVFTIPLAALREPSDVLTINASNRLARTAVELLWTDAEHAVVTGLTDGDLVVVTPFPAATDGAEVRPRLAGAEDAERAVRKPAAATPTPGRS
ncbi:MAG: efflux RND transporter periplasmic adaptor subunit [Gammaproteobacteria bacterium]|nr:efflux RND transporter periplasmic adaptor subunit [Gammaproteobacteria bacterium]